MLLAAIPGQPNAYGALAFYSKNRSVLKFWREAPGLMRWDAVWCKDSSGRVGFDYHELDFFTPPETGTQKRES